MKVAAFSFALFEMDCARLKRSLEPGKFEVQQALFVFAPEGRDVYSLGDSFFSP